MKTTKTNRRNITIDRDIRFGKPCVKGTRVAVADILDLLRKGYTIKDIPKQYPTVTEAKARDAISYITKTFNKEEVLEFSTR